jgi:hypothetical protein
MAFAYATFISNIAGMTVSGVTRQYTAPPQQLSTADLPASYPRLPIADNQSVTLTHGRGLLQAAVELVIVVEPYRQGTNITSFATCVALVDAIETALAANANTYEIDRWNIVLQIEEYGADRPYWQLVTRVEGSGT